MVLGLASRYRLAFGLGMLSVAWLLVWSLPVTSNVVRGYLENQHPAVNVSAQPEAEAIVVLGGGTLPLSYGEQYPNLSVASDREWHGARLFRADKAPLMILTSGHDPEYLSECGLYRGYSCRARDCSYFAGNLCFTHASF